MTGSEVSGEFGDFERLDGPPLGTGATGRVYRARQKSLRRPAALKVIDRLTTNTQDIPHLDARFQREILALGQIKHPNVVAIYAAGVADGKPWTAMECLEGGTLDGEIERRIRERRWFSDPEIVRIGVAAASGLAAALERGIIHRDLKPSNILFDRDGRPVVTDFGMAKFSQSSGMEGLEPLTGSKDVLGTPAFMSPEQIMPPADGPVDHRADVYALGAVLYNMATLAPPFSGKSPYDVMNRHLTEEPASIRSKNPEFSPQLESLILRCLAKQRTKRPQTYPELIRDLEAIQSSIGLSDSPPPASSRRPRLLAAAAIAVLLAGLGTLAATGGFRTTGMGAKQDGSPITKVPPAAPPPAAPLAGPSQDPKSDGKQDGSAHAESDRPEVRREEGPPPVTRSAESLRTLLAEHKTLQPDELAVIRELHDLCMARREDLRKRAFDGLIGDLDRLGKDARRTAYTGRLVDGVMALATGARDVVAARLRALTTQSSAVTVRLKDGTSVTGTVTASDSGTATLSTTDGKSVRVPFADLALEDFAPENSAAIPWLALRGLSGPSIDALAEAVTLAPEKEDLLLWLPILAWVALEDGRVRGSAGDVAGARTQIRSLIELKSDLLPLFPFLDAILESASLEANALEHAERGEWPTILAGFPESCVRPTAEREVWEGFWREATEDLILRSRGQLDWRLLPEAKDGRELLRFWDQKADADGKESTFLRDPDGSHSLVRNEPTPQATAGLLLVARFILSKDADGGFVEVTLNPTTEGSNYLRLDVKSVSLVHESFTRERVRTTLAGGPMPPAAGSDAWRRVALFPAVGRLFVFVDGKLVAHTDKASIPPSFALGVRRGELVLRSVLVKPSKEK